MNNDPVVIVAMSRHDSTTFGSEPQRIEFGSWGFRSPMSFDDLLINTIRDLGPNITDQIASVIVSSTHGDSHNKNKLLDCEKSDKKARGKPSQALATTESTMVSLITQHCTTKDVFKVDAACASGLKALEIASVLATQSDQLIMVLGIETTAVAYFSFCFNSLGAVTKNTACYHGPFDMQRDGFALGEGSAALVVCTASTARQRGFPVLATLDAIGSLTACPAAPTQPSDQNQLYSWLQGLISRTMEPKHLAYWDAHATATPLGDVSEYQLFSRFDLDCPISSFKGAIGHCVAASAVIETVHAIQNLQAGRIPPNHRITEPMVPDPRIIMAPESTSKRSFIKCSFGFGGRNGAALITVQ